MFLSTSRALLCKTKPFRTIHTTQTSLLGLLDRFRFGQTEKEEESDSIITPTHSGDVNNDYDISSQASGTGRFGLVYKAKCKNTGDTVAIKMIKKRTNVTYGIALGFSRSMADEIHILKQLQDERTMQLIATYEDRNHVHIVSEWLDGGELFDRVIDLGEDVLSEAEAARIMREIFRAVKYLHSKNITHRDLKPENIMFRTNIKESNKQSNHSNNTNPNPNPKNKKSDIVLVDFGMAIEFIKGEKMSAQVGSPSYVAPEVLGGNYDESADLWSLGVIMYILLSGEPPFHGDSPSEVMRRVREIDFDMNQNTWRFISKSGKDMVNRLLTSNPEERLTLTEAMSHDWWDDASRNLSPLPSDVITSIRVSESDNKIMRKALLIVTKGIQNLPEFDELRAAFSTFDYDCDGSITVEELGQALKTLNVTMNSDDLEAIVEEIDQDQDGKISFDEFLAAAINKEQLLDEKRLNHAFNYFDMDSSGKLDVDELFAITGNMDEARSAIAEYDKDEDGEINFQEFSNMMFPEKVDSSTINDINVMKKFR